jgi:sulfur carrier protein ThiS
MSELDHMNGALALEPFGAPEPFEVIAGEDVAALLARLLEAERLSPDHIPFLGVWLNGEELDRGNALDYVLEDGDQIALVLVPQGGGGEGGKDVGAILINLAVLVVSVMTGNIAGAISAGLALNSRLVHPRARAIKARQ